MMPNKAEDDDDDEGVAGGNKRSAPVKTQDELLIDVSLRVFFFSNSNV